ncbi:hypothetical protein RI054_40g146010 [Pseudoscourfieldia marina]
MLTRSQRRQRQISNEQEGRDVTDEAPSVDGEGTEEPTAMSDGGDANASGSRSSHLSPLTGSETSEEAARWLANFQQLYQPKLHNANYQTVLTFLVANTAQGTPAWTLPRHAARRRLAQEGACRQQGCRDGKREAGSGESGGGAVH